MVLGNGVDIIEIERIITLMEKRNTFVTRFFTLKEQAYFKQKQMKAESIAATFAAKEAVSKCFGTGVRGFNLIDIEIIRDELGKPNVVLHGGAKDIAGELGIETLMVSLSHSKTMVVAFVIALGGDNRESSI